MEAGTVFAAVAAVLALAAAVLAGAVLYMWRNDKARIDEHSSSLRTVESAIQEMSRDLEKKFLYYAHDPNRVLSVSEGQIAVQGATSSRLLLGGAELLQDAGALKISNAGTSLSLTKEGVAVSGGLPTLRLGAHYLTSTPLGVKVCDASDTCKTL